MKRSVFLTSILGMMGLGVKAQQSSSVIQSNPSTSVKAVWYPPQWTMEVSPEAGKPKNNRCPVCGTMAPPRKILKAQCNPAGATVGIPEWPSCGEGQNLTRCKRCNAAFWQDAE